MLSRVYRIYFIYAQNVLQIHSVEMSNGTRKYWPNERHDSEAVS